MEIAAMLHTNERLTPAFTLSFRALADDADRGRVLPILQRALGENPLGTLAALRTPPVLLHVLERREDARRMQLALGAVGCVATVEEAWRFADWTLPGALPHQLAETIHRARSQRRTVVYALMRGAVPVGGHRLAAAASHLPGVQAVMNNRDVLLSCPVTEAAGVASWIRRVSQTLQTALPEIAPISSALVVCPDDGDVAVEVLETLNKRLQIGASDAGDKPAEFTTAPMIDWPLAGTLLRDVVRVGRLAEQDELPQDLRRYLAQVWPTLDDATDAQRVERPEARREQRLELYGQYQLRRNTREKKRGEILARIQNMDRIPTLPAAAMEAYRLASAADCNAQKLADFVGRDPSLSARILTVVNSPHMGLSGSVDSIRHALVLLGWEEIARLALMLSNETVFRSLNSKQAQALWQHSAAVAAIARSLGARVGGINLHSLYTAALLADVGKVVLYAVAAPEMQLVEQTARAENLPGFQIEREVLGMDHAELGGMLLRRWGVPEELSRLVERHHGSRPGDGPLALESALIALSDHLAHRVNRSEPHGDGFRLTQQHLQILQSHFGLLSMEALDLLADDVCGSLRAVAA